MSDNITPFAVIRPGPQVNEDLVGLLGRLLEDAKSGEITALSYGTVTKEGNLGCGWTGGWRTQIVATTSILLHEVNTWMCENP